MPETPTTPGAGEILRSLALFAAGFLLTAAATHALILARVHDPIRLHADFRSEKLAMLAGWRGRYFSSAFGSSHVHMGFDPAAFDRVLDATPEPTRTVNLAVEGGSQSEQRVMALAFLHQLDAPPPPEPCVLLLELEAGTNFSNNHLIHPRAINIYDWPTTRLMSHFTDPSMTPTQRVGRTGWAYTAMGLHYLNIGMLSNLIFAPPLDPKILTDETMDDRRGQQVEAYLEPYKNGIDTVVSRKPAQPGEGAGDLLPGNYELIKQLIAAAPGRTLSFVYIRMPMYSDLERIEDFPDHITVAGRDVPIIDMGRPDRYPQFYHPELWHDDSHLDGQGAQMVTAVLATQLAAWYAAHGAPPPCSAGMAQPQPVAAR